MYSLPAAALLHGSVGGEGQRAVDRAVRNLPDILELFEACIDSLAEGLAEEGAQQGEASTSLPEEYVTPASHCLRNLLQTSAAHR